MKLNNFNKQVRIVAIILLFITGLNALAAGYSFIVEPSGEGLGMNVGYLKHSPFSNFLIPGLVLFVAIGMNSFVVAFIAILKKSYYSIFIQLQGCIITGWILIQILMLRMFHILHLVIFVIGIILILSGFLLPGKEKEKT